MKRILNQFLFAAALVCGAMSVSSCQGLIDAVLGEHADNSSQPTPTPTPTPTPPTYASDAVRPLTFEAAVDGVTVMLKFSDNAKPDYKKVEYSLDAGATWTALSSPAQPILLEKAGDIVMFRGDNPTYNGDAQFVVEQAAAQARSKTRSWIGSSSPYANLYGALYCMIWSGDLKGTEELIEENPAAFKALFTGCGIDTRPGNNHMLYLPAIGPVNVPEAFMSLFENTLISEGPKVTAKTVAASTLADMYKDCPRLKKATFELGSTAEGVTAEQAMGGVLGGTTGSEAEGGQLEIEYWHVDANGNHTPGTNPLTLDDLMTVSGLSTEVLGNTSASVTDENGNTSEAKKYDAATGVEILDPVSGVLELTVGDKYFPQAFVMPTTASDQSIEWSSDNPDIAIWDDSTAEIKALSPGETKIWAIHGESIKTSITVIVKAAVTDPTVNDPDDYSDGGDPTATE